MLVDVPSASAFSSVAVNVCPEERKLTKSLVNHQSTAASRVRLTIVDSEIDTVERDAAAGEVLLDLERRQDDVLLQLDELEKKLTSLLSGLGVTFVEDSESENQWIRLADLSDESENLERETRQADDDADAYIQPVLRRKAA